MRTAGPATSTTGAGPVSLRQGGQLRSVRRGRPVRVQVGQREVGRLQALRLLQELEGLQVGQRREQQHPRDGRVGVRLVRNHQLYRPSDDSFHGTDKGSSREYRLRPTGEADFR